MLCIDLDYVRQGENVTLSFCFHIFIIGPIAILRLPLYSEGAAASESAFVYHIIRKNPCEL